jgi:hypothetical protein
MLATFVFSVISPCYLDKWRLAGTQSSMPTRSGGCSGWEGAVHAASDPHAGEGRDVRAGVVPAVLRPCARERRQREGVGRRRWERASRA